MLKAKFINEVSGMLESTRRIRTDFNSLFGLLHSHIVTYKHTYKYFLHVIARHETEHSTATDIAMVKAVNGHGCRKEKNNHLSYLGRWECKWLQKQKN